MRRILGSLAVAMVTLLGGEALAGKANDTLVWSTDRDVAITDPYYFNARENIILSHHLMDTLVMADPATAAIKPLLATKWTWVSDTALEMDLRTDVKFHSGKAFDADDVVYTLNFLVDRENLILTYTLLNWIKAAEKLDTHKVRINLVRPFPAALAHLAGLGFIVEKGHYDKAPKKADGRPDFGAVRANGTGPYKLAEMKPGEFVHLVRNPEYMKDSPKSGAKIGNIRFRTLKESNTRLAEFMTGNIDWIWDVPKDQAERLVAAPNITVENAKTLRIAFIAFDVPGRSGVKYFTDKRVRQAVMHAINREAIAKNLVGPSAVAIHSACHPDVFACSSDVPKYDYSPDKAKKLLAEAGHPNGFEFDLYAYREREYTEAVIGDLSRVGLKPKLNFLQLAALNELVRNGRVAIHHSTWGSNSIADVTATGSQYFTGGQDDMVRDPEIKKMIEDADSFTDPEKRKAAWAKALAKLQEEAYWMPLFTYAKYYAWTKTLDFKPTSDEMPQFYSAKWK
ncbi:MAG: ABC transporter substrate-binding protein [Hyphomicrobiaceae bacterium]